MTLKIDILCTDGSPIGVIPPDIYGRGVGGAELALMSWAETMANRGHNVTVYNDPTATGDYSGCNYVNKADFNPAGSRDVFILFRSPNPLLRTVKAGYKIHWSCDQFTIGDFGRDIFPWVDKVVCISPYHVAYHRGRYGIEAERIGYIDLGVRLGDYGDPMGQKITGRCIFCSVPDRGLDILRSVWPQIKRQAPGASLVITSDYRLWGNASPNNHRHRLDWIDEPDVTFLGKVERARLVQEQQAAVCQPYPCTYEELFCISAAECQVSGATPVTSTVGALKTTNEFGYSRDGVPASYEFKEWFVSKVIEMLNKPFDSVMIEKARKRFSWQRICQQWERLIETGEFE
jgi:glycosyltransferase involved in cell wall biosynthesis